MCVGFFWGGGRGRGGGGGVEGNLKNANKVNKRQCGHMLSPAQTFTSVLITFIIHQTDYENLIGREHSNWMRLSMIS